MHYRCYWVSTLEQLQLLLPHVPKRTVLSFLPQHPMECPVGIAERSGIIKVQARHGGLNSRHKGGINQAGTGVIDANDGVAVLACLFPAALLASLFLLDVLFGTLLRLHGFLAGLAHRSGLQISKRAQKKAGQRAQPGTALVGMDQLVSRPGAWNCTSPSQPGRLLLEINTTGWLEPGV